MRVRIFASGNGPLRAPMFSVMCMSCDVAGMAQVTAGWETMNFSRNSGQLATPASEAQAGSGCFCTVSMS